jgi:hypothetical protein
MEPAIRAARAGKAEGLAALHPHTAAMVDHLLRLYATAGFVETHRAVPPHGAVEHPCVSFVKRL